MARFWVYVGDKIQGPVDIPSLRKVPGFNLLTQVCLEGEQTWRMADEVIEIKSYFISPPRINSFAPDAGNAAPRLEFTPKPVLEELTLPEPNTLEQISTPAAAKKGVPAGQAAAPPSAAASLRAVCEVCGYKNPRDVSVCMKCGEKLGGASVGDATQQASASRVADPSKEQNGFPPATAEMTKVVSSAAPAPVATEVDIKSGAMVEIPLSKLLIGASLVTFIVGGALLGLRSWKKKHHPPVRSAAPVAAPQTPSTAAAPAPTHKHYDHPPVRHSRGYDKTALPGLNSPEAEAAASSEPAEQKSAEEKPAASSYRVIAEATPPQKRYSSPIHSPYAVKRRADQELWTTQADQAIQQVQRTRIYGGQRTIQRNVEILLQILRDREYNAAFESGKRLSLYNDLDWSAVQKDGPLYEVRLTFSGGKEPDGSPKKPLHFAFASDLERGTVEPGGEDQVRSNTLHAFFDESRIAPEERRAIAKDTEELVMAAQPGASPLALDTVLRQFAKVYGTNALSRVADAYGLDDIKKKLTHDPRLTGEESSGAKPPAQVPPPAKHEPDIWEKAGVKKAPPPVTSAAAPESSSRAIPGERVSRPLKAITADGVEFRMERGHGRERLLSVRLGSHATVSRLWETLTGYDRLKQFVPDMLASEREGQDGAAAIVHLTSLTRYMIFVFKLNLHLRIIEHPLQHTLEFERIAGDYESLRGSIEVTTDPSTRDSQIIFNATVVPNGFMLNSKLEAMARRLLISQAGAIRAKAESN